MSLKKARGGHGPGDGELNPTTLRSQNYQGRARSGGKSSDMGLNLVCRSPEAAVQVARTLNRQQSLNRRCTCRFHDAGARTCSDIRLCSVSAEGLMGGRMDKWRNA